MIGKWICGSQLLYYIVTFFMLHTTFFMLEHIHYKYCVPSGLAGYIHSIFASNSPPCVTLRWISTSISTSIISLVSIIGPIIMSTIIVPYTTSHTTSHITSHMPSHQTNKIQSPSSVLNSYQEKRKNN